MRGRLALVLLTACAGCGRIDYEARSAGSDGGPIDGRDPAALADGSSFNVESLDGSALDDAFPDIGATPMVDGSFADVMPSSSDDAGSGISGDATLDASPSSDGGSGSSDAGDASPTDAGSGSGVPSNDTCNRPITLSLGVPAQGTTCGGTSYITTGPGPGCEPFGAPDVFYQFSGSNGLTYTILPSEGAYVVRMLNCSMTDTGCLPSDTITCPATGTCRFTWLVETTGGCGPFSIVVN